MKAVLFDLDGTLIDSFEGISKSVQYALDSVGIHEENLEKFRVFVGPPLIDSYMRNYGFSREEAIALTAKYRERYQVKGIYECALYPGVEECIRELKKRGYLIGMASSKPEAFCRTIMEHFHLLDLFDDIVGSNFDAKIDTKEQVINEVKRRWSDVADDEMILIGDTIFDVNGAKDTNIPCLVVSYGFGNVPEMMGAGAVACIDALSELPDALGKLYGFTIL